MITDPDVFKYRRLAQINIEKHGTRHTELTLAKFIADLEQCNRTSDIEKTTKMITAFRKELAKVEIWE